MRLDSMEFLKYIAYNDNVCAYVERMNDYLKVQDIPVENVISIIERDDKFILFYKK